MNPPPIPNPNQPPLAQAAVRPIRNLIGVGNMVAGGVWLLLWLFFYLEHSAHFDLSWYGYHFSGLVLCGTLQLCIGLCQYGVAQLQLGLSENSARAKVLTERFPTLRRWFTVSVANSGDMSPVAAQPPLNTTASSSARNAAGHLIKALQRPALFAIVGSVALNFLQEDSQFIVLAVVLAGAFGVWKGAVIVTDSMIASKWGNLASCMLAPSLNLKPPTGIFLLHCAISGVLALLWALIILSQRGGSAGGEVLLISLAGSVVAFLASTKFGGY